MNHLRPVRWLLAALLACLTAMLAQAQPVPFEDDCVTKPIRVDQLVDTLLHTSPRTDTQDTTT